MLNKLKQSGNKHYQFHDDFNEYQVRCRESDPHGYNEVFGVTDDVEESIEAMGSTSKDVCDEMLDDKDDKD